MADKPLTPMPVADLIDDDKMQEVRDAIVATFAGLIPGLKVEAHPGKLDISDILAADIKGMPCVLVGWTRLRPDIMAAGQYDIEVDFIAYIAVQDWVDLAAKRSVKREEVGQAIGNFILQILTNENHECFGLPGVGRPYRSPMPEFKPVFTANSYAKGVAYYAVTWTQPLMDRGQSIATDPDFTFGNLPETIDDGILLGEGADPEADPIKALFRAVEDME